MTRSRPSPSIALARDVLHFNACPLSADECDRCASYMRGDALHQATTLARALLRAARKAKS
jgi:hypothetical protein